VHSFSIVHGSLIGVHLDHIGCVNLLIHPQANILVDNGRRACLTDFGLASIRGPIQGSAFLGTSSDAPGAIRWTATELVAKDVERPTIHSDVYSFGSVALQVSSLCDVPLLDSFVIHLSRSLLGKFHGVKSRTNSTSS
jgi:serine/threonine protein kinase